MHAVLYVCIHRSQASSSLQAREKVSQYLADQGFWPQRRFAGECDNFLVGGRWSGRLSLLRLRYKDRKKFDRFWKRYDTVSSAEEGKLLFREAFPAYRGKPPIREHVGVDGEADDAQFMDEPLFEQLKGGFDKVINFSWEITEPNVIFTDIFNEWPKTPEEAANYWVVVIDYHF
jgi:hypothetical protein